MCLCSCSLHLIIPHEKTILLLCLAVGAKAQVKTLPFDKKVPAGVSVKGKVSDAIKWQDQTGENIVFLSVERKQVTGVDTPSGDAQTAKVHAYQYNKQGDKYQLVWELKDGIDECPWMLRLLLFLNLYKSVM
jgi:hypothetical protein